MKKNDFDLKNLPIEAQDEDIQASDFTLVDNTERVHEQKFQTKPTTFFKDSLKRFKKNKSSVVAAGILGTLLFLSVLIPIVDRNSTDETHPSMIYLEPKLFPSGTGFWDGTRECKSVAVDVNGHPNATSDEERQEFWQPYPEMYKQNAVTNKIFTDVQYTSEKNKYANGGYVQFGITSKDRNEFVEFYNYTIPTLEIDEGDIILESFNMYDYARLVQEEGDKAFFPENYSQCKAALYFNYEVSVEETNSVLLLDYTETANISNLNLTDIIKADPTAGSISTFKKCYFSIRIKNDNSGNNECVLIKDFVFSTTNAVSNILDEASFDDANKLMLRQKEVDSKPVLGYWSCTGRQKLHMAKVIYCDFTYDSYEATFGKMPMGPEKLFETHLQTYELNGWCTFSTVIDYDDGTNTYYVSDYNFVLIDEEKCPVKEIIDCTALSDGTGVNITAVVEYYRFYGYDSMPSFIMGTDVNGYDMLKYVFEGLRTSLLLGIASFAVCFVIGLIWGSISGYFGGSVDLIMERVTDILNGLPWIVVMTLVIKHLGQSFFVFGLSICLTGWIGTAATTRTQFYRFRGREYVLASRSLGASDARLIAKHILPNAMGTIITSSVLMIPSVIFSEATISYLGLGLKGMSSLGVILSDNQTQLTTHPYLLIFPAVIIALLMISFNLFGNGLRDAVNPSLKGEEQ